jgi:hypothetical protein
MGIALFNMGGLLAPVQNLLGWLVQVPPRKAAASQQARPATAHSSDLRACTSWTALNRCDRPRRALRVVRVVETCPAPLAAGRMVISGRMADVCAELDRLAALEAAAG